MNENDNVKMTHTIDMTPSPKIYRVLSRQEFELWQCLAELIDNSIDGFTTGRENKMVLATDPQVSITGKLGEYISIVDNASGMDEETLEKSIKAGYSGNDPYDKLGLFGMGFNIATVKLGTVTTVETTTKDSDVWHGVIIDINQLEKRGDFQAQGFTRPKYDGEVHGTKITIKNLNREMTDSFFRGGSRKVINKLGEVYSSLLLGTSGLNLTLGIDVLGRAVRPDAWCLWDKKRASQSMSKSAAYIDVSENLGIGTYCGTCMKWLDEAEIYNKEKEDYCSNCENTGLVKRERKITGWIGLQRFLHKERYGFNLLRNNRVIESNVKDFFTSTINTSDGGYEELEYPTDHSTLGGRIVGELNIDFVPLLSYTKDAFNKQSAEWLDMIRKITGNGPLAEKARLRAGLNDANDSPFAQFVLSWRQMSSKDKSAGTRLLWMGSPDKPKQYKNDFALECYEKFKDGDKEWESDEKWYQFCIEADRAKLSGGGRNQPSDDDLDDISGIDGITGLTDEDTNVSTTTVNDDSKTRARADWSIEKFSPKVDGHEFPPIKVEVESIVQGKLHEDKHVVVNPFRTSRIIIEINENHNFFKTSNTLPVECLSYELAQYLSARFNISQSELSITELAREIHKQYYNFTEISVNGINESARELFEEMQNHVKDKYSNLQCEISQTIIDKFINTVRTGMGRNQRDIQDVFKTGDFINYLSYEKFYELITMDASLLFDNEFFAINDEENYDQSISETLLVLEPILDVLRFTDVMPLDKYQMIDYKNKLDTLSEWKAEIG